MEYPNSQLEWGQLEFYKVWIKKRECEKKENKHKEKYGFPSSIQRWVEPKFRSGKLWLFSDFVMLKTTFRKKQLIKISIPNVYIKPKVKNMILQQMAATTNEACIG